MKMEILGVEVVAHNKREERFVNIFNRRLSDIEQYTTENSFYDVKKTIEICQQILDDCSANLSAMYFLDMVFEDNKYLIRQKLIDIKCSLFFRGC